MICREPEPADLPAEHGRSLAGFYIAIGVVAVLFGLGVWLWKPLNAKLDFRKRWASGATLTIVDEALADDYRRAVYLELLKQKAASTSINDRLEAAKAIALIDSNGFGTPPARRSIERAFASEARRWLLDRGFQSEAVASVELDLMRATVFTIRHPGAIKTVSRKEAVSHKASLSAVILLKDGKELGQDRLDALQKGLGLELGLALDRVRVAAMHPEAEKGKAVEPLVASLRDSDAEIRLCAARVLSHWHDPETVEPLIAVLKDPDDRVRSMAACALGELKDQRAVEPLKALLNDSVESVRNQAEESLKKIRGEESGK